MTTLGSLIKSSATVAFQDVDPQVFAIITGQAPPLDIPALVASLMPALIATGSVQLGADPTRLTADITAWTNQDDDAHEPCSLTACRHPLHPGPCKGWKGTLHSVSPGAYKQIEEARVEKANTRRLKRIADLKAQGKPIPRKLLEEIKPKPAPAHNAQAVPLGQVNQKADLAGGQAHAAGQAVSKAAGVTVKTAPPLPLGPKQKKPSVAGRGPAFVITQPKVTDTYKLDKADKITPAEWAGLSDADKTTIRNELTAIKQRGFGPQQTKADALLAKLPAPGAHQQATPATNPGAVHQAPGKVTLGQAVKGGTPPTHAAALAAFKDGMTRDEWNAAGGNLNAIDALLRKGDVVKDGSKTVQIHGQPVQHATYRRATTAQKLQGNAPASPHGLPATPPTTPRAKPVGPDVVDQVKKAQDPSAKLTPAARSFIYRKLDKAQFDSLDDATKRKVIADLDDQIAHAPGSQAAAAAGLKQKFGVSGTPSKPAQAAPAPSPASPTPAPSPAAPMAPGTAAHIQHANAVAHRSAPKSQMAKAQVEAYDKLSKADFDSLDPAAQKQIRDDLANAKAKFLDPKKQRAAADLLDRFGSRHPAPASPATPSAPAKPSGPKTYVVTHNGKTVSRTSSKPYTHAAVTKYSDGSEGITFHTSQAAAAKGNLTAQQKGAGAHVAKVIPVTTTDGNAAPSAPAAPAVPNVPAAKGYSDPMNEAVKATSGGLVVTDDVLKRVGQLSPASIKQLDDADRKRIIGRLAFIATNPKATLEQKEKAAALKRIIEDGSPAAAGKWDHQPTLNELHAEEKKTGVAEKKAALEAAEAKTGLTPGRQHSDRVKALGALTKAQFDSLTPDEQRKITDALHELHTAQNTNHMTVLDEDAKKALVLYTGEHPGLHLLHQAEKDFQAGKIDARQFRQQFLHARVAAPSGYNNPQAPGNILAAEAQKVAERNPKLPIYIRAEMIDNPYSGYTNTYDAIAQASNEFNYKDAPRLSQRDMVSLFRATSAELANSHPIHQEAVKELREHVIESGLRPGSPWSTATKDQLATAVLFGNLISDDTISPERLKDFNALPLTARVKIQRILRDRMSAQTNPHSATATWILVRQLEGYDYDSPDAKAAVEAAAEMYASPGKEDIYRKLKPSEFQNLPLFVQKAIGNHLDDYQKKAEGRTLMVRWTPQDNALKVMPAALKDYLSGDRYAYPDRRTRNATDLAKYGTKIVAPADRLATYSELPIANFRNTSGAEQAAIKDDLDRLATNTAYGVGMNYSAQRVKDFGLSDPTHLNGSQMLSVGNTDPANPVSDFIAEQALSNLSKADYDALEPAYRAAIDERINTLPAPAQQMINATLHPQAAAASPSGYTPTAPTSVPPHVQAALDTIYGVHASGKSHTMAHQLSTYGALRGSDFAQLNPQEQGQLLGDLSFIATTAKGPSADKARKLIDRFSPPGTPAGQVPTGTAIPPATSVPGQVRYATPLKGLFKAKDSGRSGDKWINIPGHGRVWGEHGAAGMLIQHVDPQTGEKRYLMVQRGPAISDPGKWTFPGGASDSKETPHQGATRETIEELGLKDDVFKDALVHGDHTFSIPGSTWKYTTVAVQVPNMIKPDLSSAHARAETSDAKWMTEAEIKALDKAGKLHAPIAGGKLEQNVISLYPQGSGVTLGQVARPGPVTKRLGRLKVPFGGRQAPANFNAWPHAHKPSKGKDLIADKTASDALRQKIKNDRKMYDGKTADGRLAAIGAMQGFDDTPTVLSKKDIDDLLATGDYIEAWRGVRGAGGYSSRGRGSHGGKTSADINEEMRSGPAYYGTGIFGNGYYLATQRSVARQYADSNSGSIVRILIPKSAVTKKYDEVKTEAFKNPSRSKAKGASSYESSTLYDPGRWAAAKGLDGIEINAHHMSPGGGASHVASRGKPAFNWLNRSVLILQKEPG